MMEAVELHRQAMALAEEASLAEFKGEANRARKLILSAYEKEKQAAMQVETSMEPTRSVLYRSAASLAIECGELQEAERLIYLGLSGSPPSEIYDELKSLLENIDFHRHLSLHGLTLLHNEFQMSMWGDVVAHGMTRTNELIERVVSMKKLIRRTVERRSGEKFHEGGKPKKSISEAVELYISVPKAASFSVSFRLGTSDQLSFPDLDVPTAADAIIDDIFESFELFNEPDIHRLREKISDPAYYRSFIGLARNIAPDGEAIRQVGFTTLWKGKERHVRLTMPREETPSIDIDPSNQEKEGYVSVEGKLLYADEMKEGAEKIKLKDDRGTIFKIRVQSGMMSDIVRPMWESAVIVSGNLAAGWITLEDIKRVREE